MSRKKINIVISKPLLGREEEKSVISVLRSGMLAHGEQVEKFEKKFADYIGTKYAIATSNGTIALHLALLALGVGKGNEVITTSFSFIASANSILFTGAKPVFVDIDKNTFNINCDQIEEKITARTKAILPVHLFGLPVEMKKINKLAKKYKLFVIEDACQAHGAKINGKMVGSFGTVGCFSFYPTKNMTTGEGGMITTNNKRLSEKVKLLRNHGMPKRYHHSLLGYNFRSNNIAAAIGLEQLKKLGNFNKKRIRNANYLNEKLLNTKWIQTPVVPRGYKHVFHQYSILIENKHNISREKLIQHLNENGISTMIYYPIPIHKQKLYRNLGYDDKLPVTEVVSKQIFSLPVHPSLKPQELKKIVTTLNSAHQ